MTTWKLPYRTMDEAGTPEAAGSVAWEWILAMGSIAQSKSIAPLHVESSSVDGGGSVTALYRATKLLAVATVFRDPMNFSVLVRWMDPEFEREAA